MRPDNVPGVDFADSYWRQVAPTDLKLAKVAGALPDETELRLLADTLPSLCWIADGDGAIGWYNRGWHHYCGSTPAAMSGWGWQAVHDPAVLPEVMERWTASIATGDAFEMTFPLRGADGVFRPFLTRVTPLKDHAGRVLRWFGVNFDVSDRVKTETALKESESYVRLLLDSSAEGFYAVDRDGVTTLCNATFVKLMGFASAADAIGRKLHDIIHHSHPDGAHYDVGDCPIYRCARDGTPAHVTDEMFYRLDGTPVPVEYWAKPIVFEGEHRGAICTFIDITERVSARARLVASEAEFRTFAQAMPNQVWASQPDGLLDWFNERVYDYGGFEPGELDGHGWAAMVHPDDAAARRSSGGARRSRRASITRTEFRLRRADGDLSLASWRARCRSRTATDGRTRAVDRDEHRHRRSEDLSAAKLADAQRDAGAPEVAQERGAERDRLWQHVARPDRGGRRGRTGGSGRPTPSWLTAMPRLGIPTRWIGRNAPRFHWSPMRIRIPAELPH